MGRKAEGHTKVEYLPNVLTLQKRACDQSWRSEFTMPPQSSKLRLAHVEWNQGIGEPATPMTWDSLGDTFCADACTFEWIYSYYVSSQNCFAKENARLSLNSC